MITKVVTLECDVWRENPKPTSPNTLNLGVAEYWAPNEPAPPQVVTVDFDDVDNKGDGSDDDELTAILE
jgi:hypothetical protein